MLSALWEYRSLIGWAVFGLILVMILGFARPVVEVFTRTYLEFILPLAKKILESTYGLAAICGILFVLWTFGWWYFADGSGYARAKGECNVEIAERERDAIAQELKTTQERLARLTEIMNNDATRALADAELKAESEARLNAIPKSDRLCFDEPTARSLWGPGAAKTPDR